MIMRISYVKVIIAVVAGSLSLLASCSKEGGDVRDVAKRTVVFGAGAPDTRSSYSSHEGEVRSLDVLVFRKSDGMLDAHGRSTEADASGMVTTVSADVSVGMQLDWFVVANAPEDAFASVSGKDGFVSGKVLLEMDGDGYMPMSQTGVITGGESAEAVSVSLERYACKVSLGSVTLDWPEAFTMDGGARLGRLALVNVVGGSLRSGAKDADAPWYNKASLDQDATDVTVTDFGGAALQEGVPYNTYSPLYCMPNAVSNNVNSSNADGWSERPTRLCLEIVIGGVSNWYPVTLPPMERNTHYKVNNLHIVGPGSIGPDYPVVREDMNFTISVVKWEDETVIPEYGD